MKNLIKYFWKVKHLRKCPKCDNEFFVFNIKRMEDFCLISHEKNFHWVIQICYGWVKRLIKKELKVNEEVKIAVYMEIIN